MTSRTFYPMLMAPHFSERPWGGTRLAEELGKPVPATGGPYGESWELSDHPDGRSTVANGKFAGRLLGELIREMPLALCGCKNAPERFPLLIKYIDAKEDLSVQVHPSDATAPAGDRGKTECWYVMSCDPGAEIIYGMPESVTAEQLREAARTGDLGPCLTRIGIEAGDFLYVPAGTVHAILAGTLICEVQQSSNTTYRLWDWNRKPERELHVEESCAVSSFGSKTPDVIKANESAPGAWLELAKNDYFHVRTIAWPGGSSVELKSANTHGLIVNVVAGSGSWSQPDHEAECLKTGQTWFIPAGIEELHISCDEGLRLLVSESLEL